MDQRLLTWALRPGIPAAGATGSPSHGAKRLAVPRLWLFTDEQRLADPRASAACLPKGRAGVILRHDADPARAGLARDLARICRARRLVLVVAGDTRLAAAVRAGTHLRAGRWPGHLRPPGLRTSSAHSIADLRRAIAARAALVFLSPAFPTASHPGAAALGPLRWAAMARGISAGNHSSGLAALGGVNGHTVRRLPARVLRAVGAIGSLQSR